LDPKFIVIHIIPISQICVPRMLLLMTVRN